MADRLGIEAIDREGRTVVLKFRPQAKVDPVRLVSLVRHRTDLMLTPPASLKLNMEKVGPPERVNLQPSAASPRKGRGRSQTAPSWWTARARESEVKPGFTKEELTKPAVKADPRAAGGVFERIGGLLSELLEEG
jgi:hypothetical protein